MRNTVVFIFFKYQEDVKSHKEAGSKNRDILKIETIGNFTDSVKPENCGILIVSLQRENSRNLAFTCRVLIEALIDVGR